MKNSKHPYEKHLAEKLVQVQPPDDPDQNWQQMKALLDKDMPRGGGSPGGGYRWWVAGSIVVAIVAGTIFGGKQLLTKEQNEAVAGTVKSVNNNTTPAVLPREEAKNNTGKTDRLPGAAYAATDGAPTREGVADHEGGVSPTGNTPGVKSDAVTQQQGSVAANSTQKSEPITIEAAEKARSGSPQNNTPALANNRRNPGTNEAPINTHNKTTVDRKKVYTSTPDNNRNAVVHTRSRRNHTAPQRSGHDEATERAVVKGKNNKNSKGTRGANEDGNDWVATSAAGYKLRLSQPSQPSADLKASPVTFTVNYTAGTVISPSVLMPREFIYANHLLPEKKAERTTASRKARNSSSHEDTRFALGLSLPLGFPIGDQQPLGYNRNAGVNTISDYLPSPHFQYHFNNRTYVQAGLQFSSPQFIRPFLLYQHQQTFMSGSRPVEQLTSISARKLYYFNVPLTVYHSPLRNFYVGGGLQYSALQSGIAYYEKIERRYNTMGPPQDYVIRNYVTKFRNDSLSGRLNKNEVRLLVDVSYYWSRFTVGLQYNQAFNNYVSFQVMPSSPYTFDKNKALQFYLRYNFWEDKKRKMPKGETLTLK